LVSYRPHAHSAQVQFAQVQSGLSQLRTASPQLQFTQRHGSQVHVGFSQVVAAVPMAAFSYVVSSPQDYPRRVCLSMAPLHIGQPQSAADFSLALISS